LISNPQVLLYDVAYIGLLKLCAHSEAKELRQLLAEKNMPLEDSLRHRIAAELDLQTTVALLELFVAEFVFFDGTTPKVVEKVGLLGSSYLLMLISDSRSFDLLDYGSRRQILVVRRLRSETARYLHQGPD
jgi:hypothetical protein